MLFPLTPPQLRLWRIDQEKWDTLPEFTIERAVDSDLGTARTAVKSFIGRHEALRTSVVLRDGVPLLDVSAVEAAAQFISEAAPADPDTPYLSNRLPRQPSTLIIPGKCSRSFVWEQDGVVKVALRLHHLVLDTWGYSIIREDFDRFLAGRSEERRVGKECVP